MYNFLKTVNVWFCQSRISAGNSSELADMLLDLMEIYGSEIDFMDQRLVTFPFHFFPKSYFAVGADDKSTAEKIFICGNL